MHRILSGFMTVWMVITLGLAGCSAQPQVETTELQEQIPVETIRPEPVETTLAMTVAETVPAIEETVIPEETVSEPTSAYNSVPRFFQTDYPYIHYGNGTIGTSGCSITCLAMVATYLTEQEYTPDQLAYHFGSYGKNNIERLEYGTEMMQLPCEKVMDFRLVRQALENGKIAIVMENERSCFTTEQHFILLTGLTEDGKILVNDPMEPNYTRTAYMEERFANGFSDGDITAGFSGGWIYDKAAMPEEPFLYNAEKPPQEENRYKGYELAGNDIYLLASFAWVVAREETEAVQQAVIETILNRVVSDKYPNTVEEVLYSGEFYESAKQIDYAQTDYPQYRSVTAAMYGPYILPSDILYFATWEGNGELWAKLGSFYFCKSR